MPGFSASLSPIAAKGHLPGSVIFISPASAEADMPSVMPLADFPSAKIERDGLAGLADHVTGRHDDPVLADDHAAAGRAADLNSHHRGQNLMHHGLDLRFQRLESGQVLGLLDRGRGSGPPAMAEQGLAKEAGPSPKRPKLRKEGRRTFGNLIAIPYQGGVQCGNIYRLRGLAEQPQYDWARNASAPLFADPPLTIVCDILEPFTGR